MIIHTQDIDLLEFANRVLDVRFDANNCTWISRRNADGTPLVVVVFSRFTEHHCEMSIASDGSKKWYSREFVGICYRYAFNQVNLRRISVAVEKDNEKSLKMCRQLGHIQECVLKNWYGDKDGILMRMTKEECRWL